MIVNGESLFKVTVLVYASIDDMVNGDNDTANSICVHRPIDSPEC